MDPNRIGPPYTVDDAERVLKQELAELQVLYHRQAEPILKQLGRLEAMKPPRPVWVEGNLWAQFDPQLFASITGQPVAESETPGARMCRLEAERGELLHLLRLVKAAGTVPTYLAGQVEYTLKHLTP